MSSCRLLAVFVCLAPWVAGQGPSDARVAVTQTNQLLVRQDLPGYFEALDKAVAASGPAADHAEAVAALANSWWRIRGDFDKARQILAAKDVEAQPAILLEKARLEAFLGEYDAASQSAQAAWSRATEAADRRRARIAFASAVLGAHYARLLDGKTVADPDGAAARQAWEMLQPLIRDE